MSRGRPDSKKRAASSPLKYRACASERSRASRAPGERFPPCFPQAWTAPPRVTSLRECPHSGVKRGEDRGVSASATPSAAHAEARSKAGPRARTRPTSNQAIRFSSRRVLAGARVPGLLPSLCGRPIFMRSLSAVNTPGIPFSRPAEAGVQGTEIAGEESRKPRTRFSVPARPPVGACLSASTARGNRECRGTESR